MADLSDVSTALTTLIAATLYPNGIGQPSVVGVGVKVYPGWPNPGQLDADLRATPPVCHVSIFPRPEERNTTRFAPDWKPVSVNTPTLTLTIAGQAITVGGAVPPANNPHNAMVFANGKPYVYTVLPADSLASVAAALAALIVVDIAGTSVAGAVVTLPNSARLNGARVGVTGSSMRELRRQERSFQIGIWADTPAHRDAIAGAIDPVLAFTTFLTMPDTSAARLVYKGSAISDQFQKDCLFRRDLTYMVEYATTQTETETQITQEQLNVSAAVAGVLPYQLVSTTFS
jgi:hypothetical protein